jgi:hypothetical protein
MATYGNFPGVQVETAGGGITAVGVGAEDKIVLFGRADLSGGNSASANDPRQIAARTEADTLFGSGSDLALAMRSALTNGANINFLYGVAATESGAGGNIDPENDTPTETVSSSSTGTLNDYPIVEESDFYAVYDATDSTVMDVEFVYEETPTAPATADTIAINPLNGKWTADSASDYDFFYNYLDWSSAFDAADEVVQEGETALYVPLTDAESVVSTLATKIDSLRDEYQLVLGLAGAQPNSTGTTYAEFNAASYTDGVDNDSIFLAAPARLDDGTYILGALAGLFGGSAISEPIYNDIVDAGTANLVQKLTRTEANAMRAEQTIPLRQAGSIRVKGNLSSSSETDWQRDFWRRRIVDRTILIAKAVGDETIGRINDEQTRDSAQRTIEVELQSLANDRLIRGNEGGGQNFFVDVYEDSTNTDEVNIDLGITPYGIVKRVDVSLTINT